MKNYGEELAYWYFRLNGFIPMADFVLHRGILKSDSDCDLLAVRFPFAYEQIGGEEQDWDAPFLQKVGRNEKRILGTFVQVKTGDSGGDNVGDIDAYFECHLLTLVRRLGFWDEGDSIRIANELKGQPTFEEGPYFLSKVTIVRTLRSRREASKSIEIALEDVIHFIMNRFKTHARAKNSARMHFPDSLIQYMVDVAYTPAYRWPKQFKKPAKPS